MGAGGHLFIGDDGKIMTQRSGLTHGYALIPEKRAKVYGKAAAENSAFHRSSQGVDRRLQRRRSGRRAFRLCPGRLTEVVLLGTWPCATAMARRIDGKKLLWDGAAMRFTNRKPRTNSCAASIAKAGRCEVMAPGI